MTEGRDETRTELAEGIEEDGWAVRITESVSRICAQREALRVELESIQQSRDALQRNNEKMRRVLVDLKWTLDADGRFSTAAIDEALR